MSQNYPIFVKRDLDGFFGLFIDNLVQLLAIIYFCENLCGMKGDDAVFLYGRILPGAAVSILFGNLFYAWQAHKLAEKTGRSDICALPYGINTPSLLVYIFFVIQPVYQKTGSVEAAWIMGLIACLGSGVIEFAGSFIAGTVRKHTPRAALLSTLAGIAIGFISMTFALQIYDKPLISILPMAVVMIAYFAHQKFPLGLPGGLVAVIVGTATAWGLTGLVNYWPEAPMWVTNSTINIDAVASEWSNLGFAVPAFVGGDIWKVLCDPSSWLQYLTVIIPMGLFTLIGSLQNIESAEVAGDSYNVESSLSVNGLGTIIAAFFGSCFPTTLYIGHPAWKSLGARAGYSSLNGLVVTILCMTGLIGLINRIIPIEAGIAITLWIGIIITAQAFQGTKKEHSAAVAFGLFPAIAAWGATVMMGAFIIGQFLAVENPAGGSISITEVFTIQKVLEFNSAAQANGFLVQSLLSMERGYIFTCMILSAITANLIDRKYIASAVWAFIAAVFAFLGLTHAFQISGNSLDYLITFTAATEDAYIFRATGIGIGYTLMGLLFLIFAVCTNSMPKDENERTTTLDRKND